MEAGVHLEYEAKRRKLLQDFAPLLTQFNYLLRTARATGIDVAVEVTVCEGEMVIQTNVTGLDTPAGRLLARQHGLEA